MINVTFWGQPCGFFPSPFPYKVFALRAHTILSHLPPTPSSRRGCRPHLTGKIRIISLRKMMRILMRPLGSTCAEKVFAALMLFKIPLPRTPPPGRGVGADFCLCGLTCPRSRTLPRSLARAFLLADSLVLCLTAVNCRQVGDNPCRAFPEPFSGRPTAFHAVGSGKPPARVSPAKTVHRTVFAPFPALRYRLSLENACRRSLGGFRSLRAATRDSVPGPCGLLRKGRRNLFRFCPPRVCARLSSDKKLPKTFKNSLLGLAQAALPFNKEPFYFQQRFVAPKLIFYALGIFENFQLAVR